MKKIDILGLVIILMVSFCYDISQAAPSPRGRTFEITARILSVEKESKSSHLFNEIKYISISAEIEIIEVGNMLEESQAPDTTAYRDNYRIGDKLKVKMIIPEKDFTSKKVIIDVDSLVNGNIYSHGDETGDWYVFELI